MTNERPDKFLNPTSVMTVKERFKHSKLCNPNQKDGVLHCFRLQYPTTPSMTDLNITHQNKKSISKSNKRVFG